MGKAKKQTTRENFRMVQFRGELFNMLEEARSELEVKAGIELPITVVMKGILKSYLGR